jgi:MarR family transcriptional regulator, organic hydroperoxide resistance regulator
MAKKDFQVNHKDESTGFLLWQVTNLWQREIKKSLEQFDLTHSQFVLLASVLWLSATEDSVTQIALSQHTKIDPMTTSTVLRTLQAKGLLARQEHPTDTRAKTIHLTKEGERIVKKAVKTVEKFDADFFASIENTAGEINNLLLALIPKG